MQFKKILLFLGLIFLLNNISLAVTEEEARKAITKEEQPKESLIQFERDYVLLKRGQKEIETALSYIYYSANQIYLESFAILDPVFLTLGQFDIERFRRHIFSYNLSFRYGLKDNMQFDMSVPVIFRHERRSTSQKDETSDVVGLGDISFAYTYQPIRETATRPAMLILLAFKTTTGKSPFDLEDPKKDLPTGSGYYSLRAGFNLTKTIDPVVVFGSISYGWNMDKKVDQVIEVEVDEDGKKKKKKRFLKKIYPGDTISFSLGMAYALTYNFALNFQFLQDYTMTTDIRERGKERTPVPNSTLNSAIFKIGVGWILSPQRSFNVGISMGLTSDAPDYALEFRFPMRF